MGWVRVHVWFSNYRVWHEQRREPRILSQKLLKLGNTTSRILPDGVVGEPDNSSPSGDQIVLAQPIVRERVTIAMEGETI